MRLLFILAALSISACRSTTPIPTPPATILFVGNSFTFWNGGGLWKAMESFSAARGEAQGAKTSKVVRGGASLKVLWKRTNARDTIANGKFDVVVLQEDLPETTVADFHTYAAKFNALAREAGSRLIFFMAWDYERLDWISMEEIAAEHRKMAETLSAEVAPCGLAWQRAQSERPGIDMYGEDLEHPSAHGTYLTLLVIYSTIYGESAEELDFAPAAKWGISKEEDTWLRRIAWETVQEYDPWGV
ncbi:MAG TPA: hypothetical protein EYQ25_07240 [Planctomycetes bacterium]|nr:hypothetical protein [Planctomycetota bacterium]HIL37801.1 hypothetical protein [Planctomycetota bacterium]